MGAEYLNSFICIQNYFTPYEFFIPSLSGNLSLESPHVSRTPPGILADLNNPIVWIVSILPLISISFNLSSKSFGTVPNAQITIAAIVTLMFHSFFNSLAKSMDLLIFSLSFIINPSVSTSNSALFSYRSVFTISISVFLILCAYRPCRVFFNSWQYLSWFSPCVFASFFVLFFVFFFHHIFSLDVETIYTCYWVMHSISGY